MTWLGIALTLGAGVNILIGVSKATSECTDDDVERCAKYAEATFYIALAILMLKIARF